MTNTAPPFVGFTDLGRLPEETRAEVLAKMLSGELSAYVYSSIADGKLDPVPITPAQFSLHWISAQTEANLDDEDRLDRNSWPMAKMLPFQIRLSDEDRRRDPNRLSRKKIGVPHWVYCRKSDLTPTASPSRYPGDALLIKEGLQLVAGGMELRAVARKLSSRAEGTSPESKVDRLRKALAKALGRGIVPKSPRTSQA